MKPFACGCAACKEAQVETLLLGDAIECKNPLPQTAELKVQAYVDVGQRAPNVGQMVLLCVLCMKEYEEGVDLDEADSPKAYARQQTSLTKDGLQVWCTRHEVNIATIVLRAEYQYQQ